MSMSFGPAFGSSDPFSELLNRFLGMSPASSPPAVQRVPIGRLLTVADVQDDALRCTLRGKDAGDAPSGEADR